MHLQPARQAIETTAAKRARDRVGNHTCARVSLPACISMRCLSMEAWWIQNEWR